MPYSSDEEISASLDGDEDQCEEELAYSDDYEQVDLDSTAEFEKTQRLKKKLGPKNIDSESDRKKLLAPALKAAVFSNKITHSIWSIIASAAVFKIYRHIYRGPILPTSREHRNIVQ